MAHIQDRWMRPAKDENGRVITDSRGRIKREKSPLWGKGKRYKVRYIDPEGNERSESFPDGHKQEAENFLYSVETDKLKGRYVDPQKGEEMFRSVATRWLDSRTFEESTREAVVLRLNIHIFPRLGNMMIKDVRPSTIQSWLRGLQESGLATSYRRVLFVHVSSIFSYAVDDEIITKNPCSAKSVDRPSASAEKVEPWTEGVMFSVRESIGERYRVGVDLGSGCGLRQGEVFGFSPDDRTDDGHIIVRRQVKYVRGKLVFAPPKGAKTRKVPLPDSINKNIDDHVVTHGAPSVTLPWIDPDKGEMVTVKLLVTNKSGGALIRPSFNSCIWKPALRAAGLESPTRADGFHALRHFYASVLLDAGESVRALSEYLGHSDPGFTLKVYTHLMPSSQARTQGAVDIVFGRH
ncbi:tyrosine-type recombinase/integrase [Saccharopolyspora erythraea]|uniref:tyrosine-type recombinase/integrase n=1 Tax=Saccharopolyspora erythraea TaxID=1836 RepID=UPI001BAC6AF8|nr:site-specific integrase [Saccharopolyspora erythraea]QUG99794.1 tyrosine-type recombinase/integrase [Saccharopolyspora erythraea]